MQGDRRAAPETLRHALVPARRDRHPDPAMPASQRPLGRDLAAAAQPGRSGLNPRLTAARTQTIEVSQVTRESPTNLSHTRRNMNPPEQSDPTATVTTTTTTQHPASTRRGAVCNPMFHAGVRTLQSTVRIPASAGTASN